MRDTRADRGWWRRPAKRRIGHVADAARTNVAEARFARQRTSLAHALAAIVELMRVWSREVIIHALEWATRFRRFRPQTTCAPSRRLDGRTQNGSQPANNSRPSRQPAASASAWLGRSSISRPAGSPDQDRCKTTVSYRKTPETACDSPEKQIPRREQGQRGQLITELHLIEPEAGQPMRLTPRSRPANAGLAARRAWSRLSRRWAK